jgi:hypothetical protein
MDGSGEEGDRLGSSAQVAQLGVGEHSEDEGGGAVSLDRHPRVMPTALERLRSLREGSVG